MEEILFEIKEEKKEGDKYARLIISPLVQGYGHTLGTSLRRVLLSSLPGAAITSVKIKGAKHQFSTIEGVREDVLDFLLNLKKVRFAYSGNKPVKLTLSAKSAGEVKAGDIKTPANVRVANPDLVLANLSKGGSLEATFTMESGVGYDLAENRNRERTEVGLILLDATFSPVEKVNIKVEETRVGRLTNYDKLTMEIWTDETISPKAALIEATKILSSYLNQIINPKKISKKVDGEQKDDLGPVGKLSVEEIGLPTRVANALSKAGFETVEHLVTAKKEDLIKVRNLGEKSLNIINIALKEKGLDFGKHA